MKKEHQLFVFLLLLVVINVFQSCFTGLLHDEAYYWLWSKHLAWGYFDHPPMVALFIAAGDWLFHSDMGVRLFFILANAATVYLLYLLVQPIHLRLFYLIIISITPLLALGFFAVPDIPLLFFTACFYVAYRFYLKKDSPLATMCLGLAMALMLYSKYHAVLVIFFVLLSDLTLLKRKSYYVAGAIGFILFLPHLWWQWQNNFPTFRFHLFERQPEVYSWWRVAEYAGGQLLLAGIPAGVLLLYAAAKQSAENKFQRALQFQLWGTYLFFLLSSFKGRTEPNWTITNIIPVVILSYHFFKQHEQPVRWLKILLPVSILGFVLVRIYYGTDLAKKYLGIQSQTQHWGEWADSISKYAGDRPVVFFSSYQKAAKYTYYTGKPAFSATEVQIRKSQFNLWDIEDHIQNKQVFVCSYWGFRPERARSVQRIVNAATEFDGCIADSFMSWNKMVFEPKQKNFITAPSSKIHVAVNIYSPYKNHPLPNSRSRITYRIYKNKLTKLGDYETGVLLGDVINKPSAVLTLQMPDEKGEYQIFISATQDNYPPPINSTAVHVKIK